MFENPRYIPLLVYTFLLWKSVVNYFRARGKIGTNDEVLDACPRIDAMLGGILFGHAPTKWDRFKDAEVKQEEVGGEQVKIKTLVP